MMDSKQLKAFSIRFARSLQQLLKMVNMFSADHKSAAGLLQRSYEFLNPLLKQSRSLTLGFIDQRILLNNILTTEEGLKPLENEFLRRGIGAVTFEAGITLTAYRTAIGTLGTNPKVIEEAGGLVAFLEQKQLEFVRIFPALKTETRNADGDTVLDVGSEEYLISKALSNMNSGFSQGIETMLTRMEAGMGTGNGDSSGTGSGTGSGDSGSALMGAGSGNGGHGTGSGGFAGGSGSGAGNGGSGAGTVVHTHGSVSGPSTGHGGQGHGTGHGTGSGSGSGSGTGNGTGNGGRGGFGPVGHGAGHGAGHGGGPGATAGLMDIQRAVEQKFEASLSNPEEDPNKAYVELGKMLSTLRPDVVYSNMVSGKSGQEATKEEVTAEVFEDTALHWALKRLAGMPMGEDAVVVEEQVFRVLMRSLQATHTASRLAQKLAEYARQYALPKETYARIQDEIRWLSLTPKQRLRELLGVSHFSSAEFRRALDLIKEMIRMNKPEDAEAIGIQYLSVLHDHLALKIDDIARVPELLRSLAGVQGEFWSAATEWLLQVIGCIKVNKLVHLQAANALTALARIVATYEDFEMVRRVGIALEEIIAVTPADHSGCCQPALSGILLPTAVDRIAEIFLDKKNDSAWVKTASVLLRWAGPEAMERLFIRLDTEALAGPRLALIRLLGRLGSPAIQAARRRLTSPEWYVVRNACKLLGDLKDPDLLQHIGPAFENKDERVQKSALQAVIDSRLPGRAAMIANVLPLLAPPLVEDALLDLMFEGDPMSLAGLERCYSSPMQASTLARIVNVIAAVQHQDAVFLLASICRREDLPQNVRNAAQQAMDFRNSKKTNRLAMKNPSVGELQEMPVKKLVLRGA